MNPKDPRSIDERPFVGMKIDDTSILDEIRERSACSRCHKSRMYYCYNCHVPVPHLQGQLPKVKLPIQIDIIKHRSEIDGKSTAVHGPILSPEHIRIYTYPDVPDYGDAKGVYLVYPSAKATSIRSLFYDDDEDARADSDSDDDDSRQRTLMTKRLRSSEGVISAQPSGLDELPIRRAVLIDSTWNQSRGIYKDERLRRLPCVVLQERASQFWRHQRGSPRWYLATVEAAHQCLLEAHAHMWGVHEAYAGPHCERYARCAGERAYDGHYDNLLFFFAFMYKKIHSYYDHEQLQSYKRPF